MNRSTVQVYGSMLSCGSTGILSIGSKLVIGSSKVFLLCFAIWGNIHTKAAYLSFAARLFHSYLTIGLVPLKVGTQMLTLETQISATMEIMRLL